MSDFDKKLQELSDLLKVFVPSVAPAEMPVLPTIKPPKLSGSRASPTPKTPKLPGIAPRSKKDPKKMAEQLKNPTERKQTLEFLKFDHNGQWSLQKALPDFRIPKKITYDKPWIDPSQGNLVHADYHGYGGKMNEVTPDQKDLIHGIDLSTGTPVDPPGKTMSAGNVWITNPLNSKKMIVKRASGAEAGQGVDQKFAQDYFGHFAPDGLNAARREVLTHNIAHGLGLGQYFPTTAGFTKMGDDFSAQEKVDGYSPEKDMHMEPIKQKYDAALQHMHDSGDLHKLAIFDLLMGNNDRHLGNIIIDKKQPKLHMIDAGRAIDYKSEYRVPSHLRDAEQGGISKLIHPKAAQWLDSMSEDKISQLLDEFIEPDSKFKHHFLTRLHNVKNNIKNYQRSADSKEKGDIKLSEQLRNAAAAKIKATPESFAATQKLAV
jgi:hypothetical protein